MSLNFLSVIDAFWGSLPPGDLIIYSFIQLSNEPAIHVLYIIICPWNAYTNYEIQLLVVVAIQEEVNYLQYLLATRKKSHTRATMKSTNNIQVRVCAQRKTIKRSLNAKKHC